MNRPINLFLKNAINYACFAITWFVAVVGAKHEYVWLGLIISSIFLLINLCLFNNWKNELLKIILITLIGGSIDSLLYYEGSIVHFVGENPFYPLVPPWMWGLWLMFSSTLNHSLAWLRYNYLLAGLVGAVAGPLSYLAGANIGALVFNDWKYSLIVYSLCWLILLPVTLWLAALQPYFMRPKT